MEKKSGHRDIAKILAESVFVSQPLSIYTPSRFRMSGRDVHPVQNEWNKCMQSSENAEKCIQYLYDTYPLLMKPCEVLVPGPAAAVVTEGNEIIGVATPEGDIKALSEPIPISSLPPSPPPLPPRPGVPPPPPPPPPMPVVKVSAVPGAKKALREEVREQKAVGNVVDAQAFRNQLKELKKVVKEEKKASKEAKDVDDWRLAIKAKPVLKRVDVEAVEAERLQRQKERKLTEDPMARHLAAIQEGPQLKKAGSCGYNMIWDPRLRKCVAADPDLSGEDVEKAVGMSIAILGDDDIKNEGCVIL